MQLDALLVAPGELGAPHEAGELRADEVVDAAAALGDLPLRLRAQPRVAAHQVPVRLVRVVEGAAAVGRASIRDAGSAEPARAAPRVHEPAVAAVGVELAPDAVVDGLARRLAAAPRAVHGRAAPGEALERPARVPVAVVEALHVDVADHQQLREVGRQLVERAVGHRRRGERAEAARPEALRLVSQDRAPRGRDAVRLPEEDRVGGRLPVGPRGRAPEALQERQGEGGAERAAEHEASSELHSLTSRTLRWRNARDVTIWTTSSRTESVPSREPSASALTSA